MNILITGGAGFIGTNLCTQLFKDSDIKIWVVDNLLTGRKINITPFIDNPNFTFIERDISDPQTLSQVTNIKFDHIYHLASPASPPRYQAHPLETIHVNTIGTENVLKLAQEQQAKILFASTSEVYGDPTVHPQPETYWGNVNSFGPRSCYDEAKRCGEAICYSYIDKFKVDVKIVRIFNTYGPHMDPQDGRVISNFINQAIKNEPITIYGDGSQTRSFCFVDDLVRGLTTFMQSDVSAEIINLGNPTEKTVLETAEIIKNMTHSQSEIVYKPIPKDDPQRRRPNIDKAKKLLGWQPKISLEEGLKTTVAYFEKYK